jgi:ubiquinone/menaquinone biosynthesis C-methylase UbiE
MTGVKLGDRLLVIGCSEPKLVAQLALKPGLTGRACALDENEAAATRAGQVALEEGALLETETAPPAILPHNDNSFDIVVTSHALATMEPLRRVRVLNEALRVLRDGGRCVAVERSRRRGLARLVSGSSVGPDEIEQAFKSAGFRAVRTLAERDGLTFIEGAKHR